MGGNNSRPGETMGPLQSPLLNNDIPLQPRSASPVGFTVPASGARALTAEASSDAGGGVRSVWESRRARMLLVCCLLFMISFTWMTFLAAWLVQHLTADAWLVQLTG